MQKYHFPLVDTFHLVKIAFLLNYSHIRMGFDEV